MGGEGEGGGEGIKWRESSAPNGVLEAKERTVGDQLPSAPTTSNTSKTILTNHSRAHHLPEDKPKLGTNHIRKTNERTLDE